MIAQNLADAHQRAAAREMPVLIVDDLETIHVEKHDAEGALRAPRTVNLGLKNADEAAVIRQSRERIGDGHRAYLLEKTRLVQQSARKHDDVAERLGQLREKKWAVKELPCKCCRCVANHIERGHDEERIVEKAGILLVAIVLDALAKANRRDQEQSGGGGSPRTRKKIRGARARRGGAGRERRSPTYSASEPPP